MKSLSLSLLGLFFVSFSIAQTPIPLSNNIIFTSPLELQVMYNTQDLGFGNIQAVNPRHDYASSSLKNPALMSASDRKWNNSLHIGSRSNALQGSLQIAYQNERGLSYGGLIQAHVFFIDLGANQTNTITGGGFVGKKLGEHWSIGTSINFLYSGIKGGHSSIIPIRSIYVDLGLNYHTTFGAKDKGLELVTGLMINHIGPKTNNYGLNNNAKLNLPTQLALAAALTYPSYFKSYKISTTFGYQAEKLLVPTPSLIDADNNGIYDYQELSAFRGMWISFNDATYEGEELDEINHRFGLEIMVNNDQWAFGIRGGLMREAFEKGRRRARMIGVTAGKNGYLIHAVYGELPFKNYSISLNKQI